MKRLFSVLAMFMTVLFSGIVFVSCSGYKKMRLEVQYVKMENGEEVWKDVDLDSGLEYILSPEVYSKEDGAYLMYFKVDVKGTSKKVGGLYISSSTTNAILESNTVKPGEAVKVLIKNVGSVRFNVIPSEGGADKAIEFGVNIYKQLEGIEQNPECLPALVTGGDIKLEALTNLINYYPMVDGRTQTNQTGVSFKLAGIGTIVDETFIENDSYTIVDGMYADKVGGNLKIDQHYVWLDDSTSQLMLRVNSKYKLGKLEDNNVVKLIATSNYDETKSTDVYVYIVESFSNDSLLVSYDNNIELTGEGLIPSEDTNPIGSEIQLFAADKDSKYRSTKIYTYTSESIYSFISKPGMKLRVFIDNGSEWLEYDYRTTFTDELGIKISEADDASSEVNSLGLKFEAIYASQYRVKLVVDFEAFDFSGSDKSPVDVLTKEIVVKVDSLATAVSINGKTYSDNTGVGAEYITNIEGGQSGTNAQLYTTYGTSQMGLPLRLQAVPTNAIDNTVYVSFYKSEELTDSNRLGNLSLLYAQGSSFVPNARGQFEVKNKNKIYLKFNEGVDVSGLGAVYMVCQVKCTPNSFEGTVVSPEYKTVVVKLNVVGTVKNIYIHKDTSATEMDTFNDKYLENDKTYTAYINLNAGAVGVSVDASQITIKSPNGLKFSKDGSTWVDSIVASELAVESKLYKLHFRSVNTGEATIEITSPNGVSKEKRYTFVNVAKNVNSINVDFDKTYINNLYSDVVSGVKRNFLAIQSDKSIDFKITIDDLTSHVKGIEVYTLSEGAYSELYGSVINAYEQGAVIATRLNNYAFNIKSNSIGFTSAVYLKVAYYYIDGLNIVEGSKDFLYEMAVYNLAKNLNISSEGKDEILYINANYLDVASVRLSASINNDVTNNIYFSSEQANNKANRYFQDATTYMYAIRVTLDENIAKWNQIANDAGEGDYFKISGLKELEGYLYLDNLNKMFSIEALRRLDNLDFNYIQVDFTICQFGEAVSQPVRKILYFGNHVASNEIVVDGIDAYNNIYLNLLTKNSTEIFAEVANKQDATYSDLDYKLFSINRDFEDKSYYTGEDLTIEYDPANNKFAITATAGGKYILEIFSKDSYKDSTGGYSNMISVAINVSDGGEDNPYLIGKLDEFKNIINNLDKHYRLSDNINISSLSDEDWWKKKDAQDNIVNRIFTGSLDGAMTIYNPISGTTIHKQYSLTDLTIRQPATDTQGYYFGLFSSNEGDIKNIDFTNVSFDISIDNSNSSEGVPVNIGAIAGVNHGTIENCTINILSSSIILTSKIENRVEVPAQNTTYNIGLVAGANYENIKAGNAGVCMVNCHSSGKLRVEVQKGNDNYSADTTNIYIGGITGTNGAEGVIEGTYRNGSSKSFNSMLSGVVNIELVIGDNSADKIMNINNIGLGGVAGYNTSTIRNVAVSGKIKANDKASIGGIVGINSAAVSDVANVGMVLEGYGLSTYVNENGGKIVYFDGAMTDTLLEQNIGGIIGYNTNGRVEDVRVLFVTFEYGDISIEANRSFIKGVGNIGGVVGKASNTTIIKAYVENFVPDEAENRVYNIIGDKANIGGFVGNSYNSTVVLGFVQADINAGDSEFYEFGNGLSYNFVYFYGDLLTNNAVETENAITGQVEDSVEANTNTYIVTNIIFNGVVSEYSRGVDKLVIGGEHSTNGLTIVWRKNELINNGNPYLEYKGARDGEFTRTITVQPSQIIVNADNEYWKDENIALDREVFKVYDSGLYIQYTLGDEISATAIVYFKNGEDNKHFLVTEGNKKGLVEKVILPSLADGEHGVRIVSGSTIATIAGDSIVFWGCGRVELEFYSMYNSNIKDTVVIFVENELVDGYFNILVNDVNRTEIDTHVGNNTLLDIELISNSTTKEGATFDTTKLYSTSNIKKASKYYYEQGNPAIISEDITSDIGDYVEIDALTSIVQSGNALGNYEVKSKAIPVDVEYIEVEIEFGLYLDLSKFYITTAYSLEDLTTNLNSLIGTKKTLVLKIYNSASDVRIISSGNIAESGVDITLDINMTTGYRKSDNAEYTVITGDRLSIDGNDMYSKIVGQDNINISMSANNQAARDLANTANADIWRMFDTVLMYKLYQDKGVDKGYTYSLNIELKDEFKYITEECEFLIEIWASSNTTVKDRVVIAFAPQRLTTFRMEHYANLVVSVGDSNTDVRVEYVSSESESALIIPGYSGLMKIYAEPTFAYCENITISSSSVIVEGKEYFIRYQQMVYNKDKGAYQSLAGITADNNALTLVKHSYVNNSGEYSYDGVLFVRTILENIVGIKKSFTTTINATTYTVEGVAKFVSRDKILLSQYKPGVYINVSDAQEVVVDVNRGYLVEQGSSSTRITAKVYGYEFNVEPRWDIEWNDENVAVGTDVKKHVSIHPIGEILKGDGNASYITYELHIASNCEWNFSVTFDMELEENGSKLTSNREKVNFYPTKYILKGVTLENVANGSLDIGLDSSKDIKFKWQTVVNAEEKQNAINQKLYSDLKTDSSNNFLKLFYIRRLNAQFNYENRYFTSYLKGASENTTDSFKVVKNGDNTYRITAVGKDSIKVYVDVYYGYKYDTENGFELEFSTTRTDVANLLMHYEFTLYLAVMTSEDAPKPIYNATEFKDMVSGENYILMNDITLENWTPSVVDIGSLDGNSKVITIKSFKMNVGPETNVGLFATISETTIIKNVTINVASLETVYVRDENTLNVKVTMGMLAGENAGIIYNCEVVSLVVNRSINVLIGDTYTLTFGGLVGVNKGNITNSRVGTEYYEKLELDANYNAMSNIIRCGEIAFASRGVMAGVVATNEIGAIISSTYMANTSITNSSNSGNDEINKTAGFVAKNAGKISYSYSKGKDSSILTTRGRATGTKLLASGAGSVAGFVFENSGDIANCYSNIICESTSAVVAGFVYNHSAGTIKQCYSASTVLSGNTSASLSTQLPFVGVGIDKSSVQTLLANGEIENSYYLDDGAEYDNNYLLPDTATSLPIALQLEDFASAQNLNNFTFIETGDIERQFNSVWTYSTAIDKNKHVYSLGITNLPELTSANHIAHSLRYLLKRDENYNYEYADANGYNLGSRNNPYIVRDSQEFKDVFINGANTISGITSKSGYIRVVNDISFKNENNAFENIETKFNYVLGDANKNVLTVLDGNGMTLSNISVKYGESLNDDVESIGLFSKIKYAVIKSLNIEYEDKEVGSSRATYAGGLAGVISDSYLIDINLSGQVEVKAHNFAGGVAGLINGDSNLSNIISNLSATAGIIGSDIRYNSNMQDISNLSYAGGIAGVIDINKDGGKNNNLSKITVVNANIVGDKAGGVAGYFSNLVSASRLIYVVGPDTLISGTFASGGLVGENFGDVKLSFAGYDIEGQENIDKAFAEYINSDTLVMNGDYGNISAIIGNKSVGGLIGVNYGGQLENSYTKASIAGGATYMGGVAGINYSGVYHHVYAQNYIDLSVTGKDQNVGGMFGKMGDPKRLNQTTDISGLTQKVGIKNVVLANVFDDTKVEEFVKGTASDARLLDYTVARIEGGAGATLDGTGSAPYVLDYGVFNADASHQNKYENEFIASKLAHSSHYNMEELYNLESPNQKEIFERLFILWDTTHWNLDNTKYMPTLKEDSVTSFIQISLIDDLKKIKANPNGNFMLMNDVEIGKVANSNYVLDIEFTGVLVGAVKSDNQTYPSFFNIGIDATDRASSAGFFRATNGARINNIGFKYKDGIDGLRINNDLVNVGGVSASDKEGRFEQVYVFGNIQSINDAAVDCVGSILGNGEKSSIIACASAMNIAATIKTGGKAGGFIGYSQGQADNVDENQYDGLIANSTYSGILTIIANGNAYVGGIVGFSRYTTISSCNVLLKDVNVGEVADSNFVVTSRNDDVIEGMAASLYVGGIVGEINAGIISNSVAEVQLEYAVTNKGDNQVVYFGGHVAIARNGNSEIEGGTALINIVEIKDQVETAYIGGIIAQNDSQLSIMETFVHAQYNSDKVNYLTFGGLIAYANNNINIESCMAYMVEVKFDNYIRLIAAGLIGQISSRVEQYSIKTSNTVGQLFVENSIKNNTINTIIGGFVGYAGNSIVDNVIDRSTIKAQGNMSYSYSALTMSTANVYRGTHDEKSHTVYSNAIIGINNAARINAEKVLYSSDYTLNFEQDSNFVEGKAPKNLTAKALIYGTELDNQGWWHGMDALPIPALLTDALKAQNILTKGSSNLDIVKFNSNQLGTALYPIFIDFNTKVNDVILNKYAYYNINENTTWTSTIDEFKGVLLGNGYNIASDDSLFVTIGENSAVSNINLKLTYSTPSIDKGAICEENNGTIFMTWVDYTNIGVNNEFGGLTHTNNGRIAYSSNTGFSNNASNAGGLVFENSENASIEYSYFTGSIENEGEAYQFYGIAVNNSGYIANCYSAGNAYNGIFVNEDGVGRVENNYFDYYASFILSEEDAEKCDDIREDGVIGYSTKEMQDENNNKSTIETFSNWRVYGITNPYSIDGVNVMTYNYGYPIHNFNQYTFEGTKLNIGAKAKATGNGVLDVETKDNIKSVKSNNAYLINNYGTLGLINSLTTASAGNLTNDKYFELEYNIKLPTEEYSDDADRLFAYKWTPIGGLNSEFKGVFTSTYYPDNIADRGIDTESEIDLMKNEAPLTITNFKGKSLFGNTLDARVTNVAIKNAHVKTSTFIESATDTMLYNVELVGKTYIEKYIGDVHTSTSGLIARTKGKVVIDKLNLGDSFEIEANDNSAGIFEVDGLIGIVESGSVDIKSISSSTIKFTESEETSIMNVNAFVGVNYGMLNIGSKDEPIDGAIEVMTQFVDDHKLQSFSGLVGINKGDISSYGLTIKIGRLSEANIIAGAIKEMEDGSLKGLTIEFTQTDGSYTSATFGGVVAKMKAGSLGVIDLKNNVASDEVAVQLPSCKTDLFGGVIAQVDDEAQDVTIGFVKVGSGEAVTVNVYTSMSVGDAYGIIIGKQLADIDVINYQFDNDINFNVVNGCNVGGFVGYTENGEYKIVNKVQKADVSGLQNVGGFIGQYKSDSALSLSRETWFLNEEYASVNLSCKINEGEKPMISLTDNPAQNFGGIIGYWNCSQALKLGDLKSEETEYTIINQNNVLTNSADEFTIGSDYQVENVVKNIGGVVGLSLGNIVNAINKAQIGVTNEPTINENSTSIVSEIKSKVNIPSMATINVGGIIGSLKSDKWTDTIAGSHHCASIGKVYGYTCVGGIVGYAESLEVHANYSDTYDARQCEIGIGAETESSSGEDGVVVGFADVGGLCGRADDFHIWGVKQSTSVYGIVNVGGIIGYGYGSVNNCSVMSEAVVGNMNVGGVAGYGRFTAVKVTIGFDDIANEPDQESVNTTIYGAIFEYAQGDNAYYYIPTNIGGVFGGVFGAVLGKASCDVQGVVTAANVITDKDYRKTLKLEGESAESVVAVNIAKNMIGQYESSETINASYAFDHYSNVDDNYIRYDDPNYEGGIGGFVGSASGLKSSDYVETTSTEGGGETSDPNNGDETGEPESGGETSEPDGVKESNIYSNRVYGSTSAFYGINVGGVAGFLYNVNVTDGALGIPKVSNNKEYPVNVAGKIFVGGHIGRICDNMSNLQFKYMDHLNDEGYINIQTYYQAESLEVLSGSYVGGVVGYAEGNISSIRLEYDGSTEKDTNGVRKTPDDIRIKIYNTNNSTVASSYVGVIAGRVDGNVTFCYVAPELCDALVLDGGTGDGKKFDLDGDGEWDLQLAHKEIKAVQDMDKAVGIIQYPDEYNYGGLVGLANVPAGSIDKNKPYTIQGLHFYPFTVDTLQSQDYIKGKSSYGYNEEDPDTLTAVAHYINQSNITISVSACTDMYIRGGNPLNSSARGWAKEYTMFRTMVRIIPQPEEITGDSIQSVYNAQYITHVARGAASVQDESHHDAWSTNVSGDIAYTVYQPVNQTAMLYSKYGIAYELDADGIDNGWDSEELKDYNKKVKFDGGWCSDDDENIKDRYAFWKHVEFKNDKGELMITEQKDPQLTSGYTYFDLYGYLGKDKTTTFLFKKVFGTITCEVKTTAGKTVKYPEDPSLYSKSGSLFEVTGTDIVVQAEEVKDGALLVKVTKGLSIAGAVVAIIGAIVITIATYGTALPATAGIIGSASLALAAVLGLATAGVGIGGLIYIANYNKSRISAENQFIQLQESSCGLMGSVYSRDIGYVDGQLNPQLDSYITINVNAELQTNGLGLSEWIDALIDAGVCSASDKEDLLEEFIETERGVIMPMSLPYLSVGSGRVVPGDIDATAELNVEDMEKGLAKDELVKLRIEKIYIPKYVKDNNELYMYLDGSSIRKELYKNYDDVKKYNQSMTEATLVNDKGYAYGYSGWVNNVDTSQTGIAEYISQQYEVDLTINKTIPYKIVNFEPSGVPGYDKEKLELDTLCWNIRSYTDTNGHLEKTVYYAGLDASEDGPIKGYFIDDPKYTNAVGIEEGDFVGFNYVAGATEKAVKISDKDPEITLFNKERTIETRATLTPYGADGRLYTDGLTNKDAVTGFTGNYYLKYDTGGRIQIERQYVLSNNNYGFITFEGDSRMYKAAPDNLSITIRKSMEDTPITVDKDELVENWGQNERYDEWLLASSEIEDEDVVESLLDTLKVGNYYKVVDGKLYTVDEFSNCGKDKYGLIYRALVVDSDSDNNINSDWYNRYVYNGSIVNSDGRNVKLFTRYIYEDDQDTFFNVELTVGDKAYKISELLMPNISDYTGEPLREDILFAESVRLTISAPEGTSVYLDYSTREKINNSDVGSITSYTGDIVSLLNGYSTNA